MADYANPDALVSTGWVAEHLNDPKVKIIEVVRKAMDDAQLELNDVNTVTKYGSRKDALQKILEDGQAELKKADQALAQIEEEARREGISVARP